MSYNKEIYTDKITIGEVEEVKTHTGKTVYNVVDNKNIAYSCWDVNVANNLLALKGSTVNVEIEKSGMFKTIKRLASGVPSSSNFQTKAPVSENSKKDIMIVRQNALSHATAIVNRSVVQEENDEKTAERIKKVAEMFEAWVLR